MRNCRCGGETPDEISRRTFLKRTAGATLATFATSLFPIGLYQLSSALAASNSGKTLVVVFQRGGNDGVNTIVPYSDPQYYVMRPLPSQNGIGIAPPGSGNGSGIDLAGTGFALHPSLQPFFDLYQNKQLAIITGAGEQGSSRSHFTRQDTIEHGFFHLNDGWLNRYLRAVAPGSSGALRAAGIGAELAKSLRGSIVVPSFSNLSQLSFTNLGSSKSTLESNLRTIYNQTPSLTSSNPSSPLIHTLGPNMLDKVRAIEAIGPAQPQHGAQYTQTSFGAQLRDVAHMIRSGVGLEIATVDIGGWDTHDNQGAGGTNGTRQAGRLADFSTTIRAFVDDLGPKMSDVVLLTCTEFGRTVKQNASGGTDHGRGSVWFLMGANVKGGLYHGQPGWAPSLTEANLDDGRYVNPTVNYLDIFSDVLVNHFKLNTTELHAVLPGHTHTPVGLFR